MREYQKNWYANKKKDNSFVDKRNKQFANWYAENKEKRKEYLKEYQEQNKNIINAKRRAKSKERRLTDPKYKLRAYLSNSINRQLSKNQESKMGLSCINHLPFTIEELREYLEKQFEPWMNWNNRGRYNSKTWDDNNQATWTWQLDHIIPHANFQYTSMIDTDFEKCWSLNNLRPISAKTNILKGSK
jgi:hypothetical protein